VVDWAGVLILVSNGKVGLNGISYYAVRTSECAALQAQASRGDLPWGSCLAISIADIGHFTRDDVQRFVKGLSKRIWSRPAQRRFITAVLV